jgi:hypothetical protein
VLWLQHLRLLCMWCHLYVSVSHGDRAFLFFARVMTAANTKTAINVFFLEIPVYFAICSNTFNRKL